MLSMVARHFSSSAFSLHITRSFDAARILTMACIATVADAVVYLRYDILIVVSS
jgi:hypothetical protein